MPIGVYALATHIPENKVHNSTLGTVVSGANHHLFDPAGNHSRVPTVRRGVTRMYCPVYEVPTADENERTADLATNVVGKLLHCLPQAKSEVTSIIHSQCTLDQQILGSVCLRVQNDHFPNALSALTVGQLGTAGIPTVFRLVSLTLAQDALTCVSSCDKWIAPFVRRVPGLVTHGDASAACLVGAVEATAMPIAVVENIATSCIPPAGDMWTTSSTGQRLGLLIHAASVIEDLLAQHPELNRVDLMLAGDGYGHDFAGELSKATSIAPLVQSLAHVHLSSAAALFALSCAIGVATAQSRPRYAVIWTASQSGHAGAMLVRVYPAKQVDGIWITSASRLPTS